MGLRGVRISIQSGYRKFSSSTIRQRCMGCTRPFLHLLMSTCVCVCGPRDVMVLILMVRNTRSKLVWIPRNRAVDELSMYVSAEAIPETVGGKAVYKVPP